MCAVHTMSTCSLPGEGFSLPYSNFRFRRSIRFHPYRHTADSPSAPVNVACTAQIRMRFGCGVESRSFHSSIHALLHSPPPSNEHRSKNAFLSLAGRADDGGVPGPLPDGAVQMSLIRLRRHRREGLQTVAPHLDHAHPNTSAYGWRAGRMYLLMQLHTYHTFVPESATTCGEFLENVSKLRSDA